MKKTYYVLIAVAFVILAAAIFFMNKTSEVAKNPGADIIYFQGEGCPHCEIVQEYMAKNNVESVVPMEKAEVFFNKENQKLFQEKAKICKIPEKGMGVPMLWAEGKCLVGDKDIISYFEERLKK